MQNISTFITVGVMWLVIIPSIISNIFSLWCSCIVKTDKIVKAKSIFTVMKILNYSLKHKEVEISIYDFDIEKEEELVVIYSLGTLDLNTRTNSIEDISKLYDCIYLKIGNKTFIIYYTKHGIINKIYYKKFLEKLSRRY